MTDINLEFYPGEVHALLGENGAGKSTLIKIISGVYQRNNGSMLYNGEECSFENARQAIDKGISVIHQELSVIPDLTVAENIYLGREIKKKSGILDRAEMKKRAQEILEDVYKRQPAYRTWSDQHESADHPDHPCLLYTSGS